MEKTNASKIKKIMHVLNPMAGKGTATKIKENLNSSELVYMSKSADEATEFIKRACIEDPDTCFTVYGGDGTVFKAVNALMESGNNQRASLKIVPVGSGNDFVKSFEGEFGEYQVDVMKFNDKYAVNVINMGFDCNVVQKASKLKKLPLVTGKASYILGVVGELVTKKPLNLKISLTNENGETENMEGDFLLAAVANAKWYGGGFKVAPIADVSDGLLDAVLIKNVGRARFISIVGDFKKGLLVDENGKVRQDVEDILVYKRCTSIKIDGCGAVCADGEIFKENSVDISVMPKAINYIKE
ncbi:MAG: hypothetical protein E7596_03975 [Ruminococcaceae bacterium]|nr:hypothetical protein [Oscillospiraceae bacterium]